MNGILDIERRFEKFSRLIHYKKWKTHEQERESVRELLEESLRSDEMLIHRFAILAKSSKHCHRLNKRIQLRGRPFLKFSSHEMREQSFKFPIDYTTDNPALILSHFFKA
jgi:hypothetical protein